jgi:hypothetical protein
MSVGAPFVGGEKERVDDMSVGSKISDDKDYSYRDSPIEDLIREVENLKKLQSRNEKNIAGLKDRIYTHELFMCVNKQKVDISSKQGWLFVGLIFLFFIIFGLVLALDKDVFGECYSETRDYRNQISLLEQQVRFYTRRVHDLEWDNGQLIASLIALRESQERTEQRLYKWYRSPVLWFFVGSALTCGIVALAIYAFREAQPNSITVDLEEIDLSL